MCMKDLLPQTKYEWLACLVMAVVFYLLLVTIMGIWG